MGVFGSVFYLGLKFDRVSPWADLKTNVVVITIVPVETLIGVSPVFQPYISVTFPYTFGLVGVSPLTLPYTSIAIFSPRLCQKHQHKNITKYPCLQYHSIYSTLSYHKILSYCPLNFLFSIAL
jgi:hypothetical protein